MLAKPAAPYSAYSKAQETLSATRQIVVIYDGAINYLKQAQAAHEKHDIEERYNLLNKTLGIIGGLQSCLDFDKGGEPAKLLFSFYNLIESHIWALHRNPSDAMFPAIIDELVKMRDIWELIDQEHAGDLPFDPNHTY
jgi:flagellar secretion chaperone FliS